MDYFMMGKRIKKAREKKGWTQSYLGELLESDGKYISRIELGKSKPSLEFLVKLANALGKSTDYLLQDSVDYMLKSEDNQDILVIYQEFGKEKAKRMMGILEIIYDYMKNKD